MMDRESPGAETSLVYAVKGFTMRGYIAALREAGMFDDVLRIVEPATREMMLHAPPSTAWVDGNRLTDLELAIEKLRGVQSVRSLSRVAAVQGSMVILRPVIEGFLRLFGATPTTLLTRIPQFASVTSRGCEYHFESTGPRSGVLTMAIPSLRDVPLTVFHGLAGSAELAFEYTHTPGRVHDPEYTSDPKRNAARIRLTW